MRSPRDMILTTNQYPHPEYSQGDLAAANRMRKIKLVQTVFPFYLLKVAIHTFC